ncbi:MAG: hypothetical protein AAB472_00090 [Patescibacteria group bacterium]
MLRHFRPLIVLVFLCSALPAHAQFTGVTPLNVTINPGYPRPYETVTVTADSTVIDLSASVVTVSVNGKVVQKGSGVERVPIGIGGPGQTTTITVTATTGGKTYTKSLSVRPADVALVKEPLSTTHYFYEGGGLIAPEGRVHIVAIADMRTAAGTRIPESSLVYSWKAGDQILQEQSGIGRSVLSVTAPVRYRDAKITVTVTNLDSSIVAQASTLVAPVDPIVRIYKTDALLGTLFSHALKSPYTLTDSEESLTVVPYFFGADPTITWTVNGQSSGGTRSITIRSTGSGAGSATVGVGAKTSDTHQSASALLSVLFGAPRSGIFGF